MVVTEMSGLLGHLEEGLLGWLGVARRALILQLGG